MDLKKFYTEKVLPFLKKGADAEVKPAIEIYVKQQIEAHSDEVVDMVLNGLKDLIPGTVDDAIINARSAVAKANAKKFLLEKADLISDKV